MEGEKRNCVKVWMIEMGKGLGSEEGGNIEWVGERR